MRFQSLSSRALSHCCPVLGTSENAVRIQIAVALIAFLLLRMAKDDQTTVQSPLAFARLVRANIMHRKKNRPIPQAASRHANRPKPNGLYMGRNLNRTAVGLTRG
ncbi:Hypothetical protein RG1141_CH06920 [Neorhizobium galegae bv. officinalis bv. officinalis str. HAMBI 1141]|uniref:Uncharacterized protein n=1 Tax=Neorhizobium galegae bv. officinalis bv. officinalis str. HAMBI 1141 TaxID=1028801 RepID=A0A068T3J8_NEOGA|nr:Hypothetical protein RG1141_CH06920 [Neorhizobium galegae bv. officinalis bv. officinalis str. HAMBI 1141]